MQMVGKGSATHGLPNEVVAAMPNSDHLTMCRPVDAKGREYAAVEKSIKKLVSLATSNHKTGTWIRKIDHELFLRVFSIMQHRCCRWSRGKSANSCGACARPITHPTRTGILPP